jgi:iron complex outermembrane receptor protein
LTSKLLYGRAFRAPSFRELYVYNNVFRGNTELKAETIDTWELALDWRAGETLNLAANLFHYRIEDKLLFMPIPETTLLGAVNQGSQSGHGLELEARWKINARASLLFNYAHARAENNAGLDIGDYPRHTAYLRGDWLAWPNWYLNAQANWVADRWRQPGDNRPPMDDYSSVDLSLRYKNIRENTWNFAVGVRNLFDSDRRESVSPDIPGDLPLPGRSFFVELRYRF